MMSREEFLPGWTLLITQPWGRTYRGNTPEAAIQSEFYFDKLNWAHPGAWMKVAELYAQGNDWPSVNDLKRALQQVNQDFMKALPEPPPTYEEMPENVREIVTRLSGKKGM